ncbi:MAG: YjbQ family protein [Cutibacterium avidum]|uniref:YjbQ family protein n=1 Tax=Cutibacterium avidum TaxID=33010 RepID=UPI0022E0AA42|nr:YjbQ family protein [Cutibacterium avidum]MBS5744568.1 YjbQ family protein [Propionibacterium sp.]MDU2096007.1 YjbQ family protein [Negativicoccus succinicivorans]MDK7359987.1 YjbQ family protein [Cutibacterium avidum]MDK7373205.1 YjbQ family protein [Cutibacterium avidum]MDU3218577.1 YjbQ family protein [Cutibacterium avidum]
MTVHTDTIQVRSKAGRPTYFEITNDVRRIITESGIKNGICTVASTHTTCSVFFEEYCHDVDFAGDEYLQADLNEGLDKIFPRCMTNNQYYHPGPAHVEAVEAMTDAGHATGDTILVPDLGSLLNTEAHLRGTLIGASQTFVIEDGEPQIGAVGYIYFVDWDPNRERDRKIKVAVIGE